MKEIAFKNAVIRINKGDFSEAERKTEIEKAAKRLLKKAQQKKKAPQGGENGLCGAYRRNGGNGLCAGE